MAKVGTPSIADRSSQLTAAPWRPRVRWAVARIGECELSGAGSASEQAQLFQKPNGFTNTISTVAPRNATPFTRLIRRHCCPIV